MRRTSGTTWSGQASFTPEAAETRSQLARRPVSSGSSTSAMSCVSSRPLVSRAKASFFSLISRTVAPSVEETAD